MEGIEIGQELFIFYKEDESSTEEKNPWVDHAVVLEYKDNILTLKSKLNPEFTQKMKFFEEFDAWFVPFEGLHGEPCINENLPYRIKPVVEKIKKRH